MTKQQHKDRLSGLDAFFLALEPPTARVHVGAVLIFEGPPPTEEEFLAHIDSRLHLVPRFRQKLAFPPLGSGRPVWIDDARFALEHHVCHTTLPPPGSLNQLREFTGRVVSQRLDRAKPLWELHFVQGLSDDRFALVSKVHHCLVDGVSGVDLTWVLLDSGPVPQPVGAPEGEWIPRPEPSALQLVADGLRDRARQSLRTLRALGAAATTPRRAARRAGESALLMGEVAWAILNAAPGTPLNGDSGPHRRFAWARCDLVDFKLIKSRLGGTVNDVVLAVVAGAVTRFLRHRGARTEELELRVMVPMSVRAEDEHGQLGNRVVAMRAPLPTHVRDPVQRLRQVRETMAGLKVSRQLLAADMIIAAMDGFGAPTLIAEASRRLDFHSRLFNLIVTNVPGPDKPLYVLGHELLDLFPVAPLAHKHSLVVAVMSYNGKLSFGLLADFDAIDDLALLPGFITESLGELVEAARDPGG